jgi:hypothetical protein
MDYTRVTCCRFNQRKSAREYLRARSNGGPECPDVIALSKPGDAITITRLTSGFNSTRLLHRFLVFEFRQQDGESELELIEVSDEMIKTGVLRIMVPRIGTNGGADERHPESEGSE